MHHSRPTPRRHEMHFIRSLFVLTITILAAAGVTLGSQAARPAVAATAPCTISSVPTVAATAVKAITGTQTAVTGTQTAAASICTPTGVALTSISRTTAATATVAATATRPAATVASTATRPAATAVPANLSVSPVPVTAGGAIKVSGSGFAPNSQVDLQLTITGTQAGARHLSYGRADAGVVTLTSIGTDVRGLLPTWNRFSLCFLPLGMHVRPEVRPYSPHHVPR